MSNQSDDKLRPQMLSVGTTANAGLVKVHKQGSRHFDKVCVRRTLVLIRYA
jgi:hypothetical protein